jgi:hypothetical protein
MINESASYEVEELQQISNDIQDFEEETGLDYDQYVSYIYFN